MKTRPLSSQRPLQLWMVKQGHFVGFGKLQGTFERAADVIGAGAHSEVVGDGIKTINMRSMDVRGKVKARLFEQGAEFSTLVETLLRDWLKKH